MCNVTHKSTLPRFWHLVANATRARLSFGCFFLPRATNLGSVPLLPLSQPGRTSARDSGLAVSAAAGVRLEAAKAALISDAANKVANVSTSVVEAYWEFVAPEDLIDRSPEEVAKVVADHVSCGRRRRQGTANVVVRAPHESQSRHTVVDIVTDDMPFLVDSVVAALQRLGNVIDLVVHPQFFVTRDADGVLNSVTLSGADGDGLQESWMHIECAVDPEFSDEDISRIASRIHMVLDDVKAAVSDWKTMQATALTLADAVTVTPSPTLHEQLEASEFLRWLADNHFTFLGYREYDLICEDGADFLRPRPATGLGILREDGKLESTKLSDSARAVAHDSKILVLAKANSRATVHRSSFLDYIGIKQFRADGTVFGELRFVGLFTSLVYTNSVLEVPVIAGKVAAVLEDSGLSLDSHSGKDLLEFLEIYPRDELFQVEIHDLTETARSVLQIAGRHVTRVFIHTDRYARFVSALVYLPRDRYNSQVRGEIEAIIKDAFNAFELDTASRVGEQLHARLHIVARVQDGLVVTDEIVSNIRQRVTQAARSWDDDFADEVFAALGEQTGARLLRNWLGSFADSYRSAHTPTQALADVLRAESLVESADADSFELDALDSAHDSSHQFRLYTTRSRVLLSEVLPLLQNLGARVIDERPYELRSKAGASVRVYEFGIDLPADISDAETLSARFGEAFLAAWSGKTENFALDSAVTRMGMTSRSASILRAYARYLRQTQQNFSMRYLEEIVLDHPDFARGLMSLFHSRFDPDFTGKRALEANSLNRSLETYLDKVTSLDADRILRGLQSLINATVRTNAYVQDAEGNLRSYLAFKFDSSSLHELLPSPRPLYEIWVCSPDVEGVHLRFGRVARGGLRWSDRRDDVRTEVLGLVKAQMVKNTVIVPVGAKGGFVVQRPSADPDARMSQGIACYETFISGLLDVTDNIVDGQVVPPSNVVRHDADDPYLVVAADKGTAKFSDIANAISLRYEFWLGDAFASGGSAGYDHKAMGITAKGAWESVTRHFRELGLDTQNDAFTVVGVGDMSGDVFGNGMLCSSQIRLLAAFDHRHIFIDPAPDAAVSFAERSRLFALPGSSWLDYDSTLISPGGGVFARDAKSISVSPEMVIALGLNADVCEMTPTELMRAILQSPADLFWNGGIGTYVKSVNENHSDVGDKANDAIRVNGNELRCRVVAEGGNLGFTQLGRIDAAKAGVRINTDAIDNSAGVDTSDHEVNIKIFFDSFIRRGAITIAERDSMLLAMTEQVAADVLRDNYEQNVVLGNARAQANLLLDAHRRFMIELEQAQILDRTLEFLPNDSELSERAIAGQGLTSPELAVLLAYAKLHLNDCLTKARLADVPHLRARTIAYFPALMQEKFGQALTSHPLSSELVTTMLVNQMVNEAGISFAFRAWEETGADYGIIARAFLAVREVFSLDVIWNEIEQLDGIVPTAIQCSLYLEVRRLVDRATRWFIVTKGSNIVEETQLPHLRSVISSYAASVPSLLHGSERDRLEARVQEFLEQGVPHHLATKVASLLDVFSLLDVTEISDRVGCSVEESAQVYFSVSAAYDIDRLLVNISALPRNDRWNSLARAAMRADVYSALAAMTARVLRTTPSGEAVERVAMWERANPASVAMARSTLAEVVAQPQIDLATLSVAVRSIRSLLARSDVR
jgi:glutamate dehydrogenase